MTSRNLCLKHILTTASTLAIVLGAASEAGAAAGVRNLANNAARLRNGTPANYQDGRDGVKVTNAGGTAITLGNGAVSIRGIDLNNIAGSTIIVGTADVALGPVKAGGVGVTAPVTTSVRLALDGIGSGAVGAPADNDYSGLGIVTLSNNAASKIFISTAGAATFANDFAVSNKGVGLFVVGNGSNGNTFSGNVGTANLQFGEIQLQDNVIFKGANIAATLIRISDDGIMTLDSTHNPMDIYGPVNSFNSDVTVGALDQGSISTVGPSNITFHNPIGAIEVLTDASFVGTGAATTLKFDTSINAATVSHRALTLDATAGDLAIHAPTRYTLTDATYNIGNNTIKIVAGGPVVLQGDIVIKANYVGVGHVSLDLSTINLATINVAGFNSLTFEVTGAVVPAKDAVMIMISPLIGGNLAIPQDKLHLINGGKWVISATHSGHLIYDPDPVVAAVQHAAAQALASTGATSADLEKAEKQVPSTFGGKGLITNDGTTPGAAPGQKVLNIIDPKKFSYDLSTEAGAKALLDSIGSSEDQKGFLAFCEEQINQSDSIVFIEPTAAAGYAITAKNQGYMRDPMADAISHYQTSGISQELIHESLSVSAHDSADKALEMSDRITEAPRHASYVAFESIGARAATMHFQTSTFTPVPVSHDNLLAEAQGVGAGSDGVYDKFGIWGGVRAVRLLRNNVRVMMVSNRHRNPL